MLKRGLEKIAAFGTHHPKPVLITLLILTLLALIPASRLKFETRLAPLLPKEIVPELERASKEWQGGQFLFLFVLPPKGHRLIDYDLFIRQLKTRIGTLPAARRGNLENAIPKGDLLAALISGYGTLLMDEEEIGELEQTLTREEIRIRLERSLQPGAEGSSALEQFDPLRLSPLLLRRFPLLSLIDITQSQNYLVSKDGSTALLIFGLTEPASRHEFSKKLKADIRKIRKEIWGKMGRIESLGKKGLPPPQVVASGPHFVVLDNRDALRSTLWQTALITAIAIFSLLGLLFRKRSLVAISLIPVFTSLIWTLALAGLTVGRLNFATATVAAVLLGLGIDFSVHLLTRYLQERRRGLGHLDAILLTWRETGHSLVYACLTTCLGFSFMTLAHFRGIREVGLLVGTGTFLAALVTLLLLPPLLAWLAPPMPASWSGDRSPWFQRLVETMIQRRRVVLLGALVVLTITLWKARDVRVEIREEHLFASKGESLTVLHGFEDRIGASLIPLFITIRSPDLQAALQKEEAILKDLETLRGRGLVAAYSGLSLWLPPQERQKKILARLSASQTLVPEVFQNNYETALQGLSTTPSPYLHFHLPSFIRPALRPRSTITLQTLRTLSLGSMVDYHLKQDGSDLVLRTSVFPVPDPKGLKQRELLEALAAAPPLQAPGVTITSPDEMLRRLEPLIRKDFLRIVAASFAGVFLLGLLYFRRLAPALIALIPLLFGGGLLLATWALAGMPLNLLNLFWAPMLFGMGIDGALYLLGRFREGRLGASGATVEVATPIFFSSVTTIAGFGSNILSAFPAVRSSGLMIAVGMTWILIGTLIVLPTLVSLLWERK